MSAHLKNLEIAEVKEISECTIWRTLWPVQMHMYLHLASNSTWLFSYSDICGTVDGSQSLNWETRMGCE